MSAGHTERLNAALEGRYRIEREVGQGGMATVYLARDEKHNRNVALKVLKPELAAVVGAERFLAEIETTANLQHPHILPLFDSGEADTFLFYVMPYVQGETLRDRLDREHQLPVDDAVQIARNVAEALDYAHKQGVIHRDIKPGNILLQSGKPVISDFGIALAVGAAGGGRLTETGLSLGTPHYMSPEQATGDLSVGASTDVYALGCVLYEMLVGEPPYTGSTPQAILGKIIAGELPSAVKQRASIPGNVDAAIRMALEKVPADRFISADALASALADQGFTHRGDPVRSGARRTGLWNPLSTALAALALLLAIGLARSTLEPEAAPVAARFELVLPDGFRRMTERGVSIDLSPDGSRLALLAISDEGEAGVWVRSLGDLTPTLLPGTADARNIRFSPDGEAIAFNTPNSSIRVVSLVGAPPRTILSESVASGGVAWGPDGTLYFVRQGQGIWRVPLGGGEPEEVSVLAEGETAHAFPDVVPGGDWLLFTRVTGAGSEIVVQSLATGESRTLFEGSLARYASSGHVVYIARNGSLAAAPFDAVRMVSTGAVRALLEAAHVAELTNGYFTISRTGVLAYRPGDSVDEHVPAWIGSSGVPELLDSEIRGHYQAPAISPDGTRIALERDSDTGSSEIWIYEIGRRTFAPLVVEGSSRRPFWSPDGSEVGFTSARGSEPAVYAQPSDFSGEARLLRAAAGVPIQEALWTPDGQWLVYRQGTVGVGALYYARPHPDSTARLLLDAQGHSVFAPAVSPDGLWLAYTSDESGAREVYVRSFPGSGGRIQLTRDGARDPVWGRTSERLNYRAENGFWVAADFRPDAGFETVSLQPLAPTAGFPQGFTSQQFDISPDGQRVLGLLRTQSDLVQPRDVIVQDFFQDLNRLVPPD